MPEKSMGVPVEENTGCVCAGGGRGGCPGTPLGVVAEEVVVGGGPNLKGRPYSSIASLEGKANVKAFLLVSV